MPNKYKLYWRWKVQDETIYTLILNTKHYSDVSSHITNSHTCISCHNQRKLAWRWSCTTVSFGCTLYWCIRAQLRLVRWHTLFKYTAWTVLIKSVALCGLQWWLAFSTHFFLQIHFPVFDNWGSIGAHCKISLVVLTTERLPWLHAWPILASEASCIKN